MKIFIPFYEWIILFLYFMNNLYFVNNLFFFFFLVKFLWNLKFKQNYFIKSKFFISWEISSKINSGHFFLSELFLLELIFNFNFI